MDRSSSAVMLAMGARAAAVLTLSAGHDYSPSLQNSSFFYTPYFVWACRNSLTNIPYHYFGSLNTHLSSNSSVTEDCAFISTRTPSEPPELCLTATESFRIDIHFIESVYSLRLEEGTPISYRLRDWPLRRLLRFGKSKYCF